MLCRAVIAAVALSYVLCVLLLSGLQKEDLEAGTLQKLARYNVNIHDMNNESLRNECILNANISKLNITQQSETADVNNNNALYAADTHTSRQANAMDYFKSKDPDKNIDKPKSDVKPLFMENDNTKTSELTIDAIPKDISGMYLNKEISHQTNYMNKKIRNINIDPNQPSLESVLSFWNKFARNKLTTEEPTTRHTFAHSREMEYINRIIEEHLATRNIHSTTDSPKPSIDKNTMINDALLLDTQLLKNYLIPLSHNVEEILKTVNISNNQQLVSSSSIPPVSEKPNKDGSTLKSAKILTTKATSKASKLHNEKTYTIPPLMNKNTNLVTTNENSQIERTVEEIISKPKPALANNENLEDWYSDFFRHNMVTPTYSTDEMAKLQFSAFHLNGPNLQQFPYIANRPLTMDKLLMNRYPAYLANNDPNQGPLFNMYWVKNNKLFGRPKEIPISEDNLVNTNYFGQTSKPKENYGEDVSDLIRAGNNEICNTNQDYPYEDKDLKLNGMGTLLAKETLKLPLISYGKETNSLSFMRSHFYENRKMHLNELYGTNLQENPQDESKTLNETTLIANNKIEGHELSTDKERNEPIPDTRTNESPLMKDIITKNLIIDILTKQYPLLQQNNPTPTDKEVDKTLKTSIPRKNPTLNLKPLTKEEKVIQMANTFKYINDILKINEDLKADGLRLSNKDTDNVNKSVTNAPKLYTTVSSKQQETTQQHLEISTVKVNRTMPIDWIKEIAESVKNMVLKDIRQMVTTTVEPKITTILTTTSRKQTTLTTKTTAATTTVTSTTTKKQELKKTHDADYVLQKLMDLIQGLKSSTERAKTSTTPSVAKQEQRTPQSIYYQPTYSPIILKHRLEIISPPFHSNERHPILNYLPNINDFQLQRQQHTVQRLHSPARSTNAFRKPPITIQTNLYEIAPLGIPIEKPMVPFNQIIVVTTKVPPVLNKGKFENKKIKHKVITKNVKTNKISKVQKKDIKKPNSENHKNVSQSKQTVNGSGKIHNLFITRDENGRIKYQQPISVDNLQKEQRDRIQSIGDGSKIYRDESQDKIDLIKKLRISENMRHHEPSYLNRTMRYRERTHYYNIDENERDKDVGFHSRFRQARPPHDVKKFHERLERMEELPESDSKDRNQSTRHGNEVASRQQVPFNSLKTHKKFDDTHFKNFLQTQQKVNEMLERILATKTSTERPDSVEIL